MALREDIRQANIEVHRKEAPIYDLIHPEIFNASEQARIDRDLDLIKDCLPEGHFRTALDIGCGTGNLTLKFAALGYTVKAVDISTAMIEVLQAKLRQSAVKNVECIVGDGEEFLLNENTYNGWDIISFSSVLHHLPDYESTLMAAIKKLRPGGILYVCHEPLVSAERKANGALARLINAIDYFYIYLVKCCAYLRVSLRDKTFPTRIDYSVADYHVDVGIDIARPVEYFNSIGAKIILYESYPSRFWEALSYLDRLCRVSYHSSFRLIVRSP